MKDYLRNSQRKAIEEQKNYEKCLINMWCGTGKTRTFTIDLFIKNQKINVIVFPSLGLINQYCNDYILSIEPPFQSEFDKYECLSFCSDDDGKLKSKGKVIFTTIERKLNSFIRNVKNKLILVTYQSFEKFISFCIDRNIIIDNLIFDEAHHIVGGKFQDIVFNNDELDAVVKRTRYYTATPVNKNGITMYDRENPQNSDCGPLVYEYLYYQAVEDKICKSFETQITLYTQKPEYKNKYQPIFECIIRACLSGKYKYWNILTYHSYVNENDNVNDELSFVKEFASTKNQKLVENLFAKIQNEEFPDTKDTYSVENVILKGVYADTKLNRQEILDIFDKKVEGRIYILASCQTLNEGIDTKWANMGVPINPSQSVVKESQRIGRLVRIPEEGMTPAIILIPCMIDYEKYSKMDTPELKDQMVREELSESGNFNTALNVISAFKYQYDPELFEMCLKYPNMYAPKEVKDNLSKQGLIIEETKGDLLDNLKYICDKENIILNVNDYNGKSQEEIFDEIGKRNDRTIEVHTQNHDEPIKVFNKDATNVIRLFHCEDDDTFSPIVEKEKTEKIKRDFIEPPKKRQKIFSIHTHPDLDVLWKIKENGLGLEKEFCQCILDVDIDWNEKKWFDKLEKTKEFMNENKKRPKNRSEDEEEKRLGKWISAQMTNYKKKSYIMKEQEIYDTWTQFINDSKYKEYFIDNNEKWYEDLEKTKEFMNENKKRPKMKSPDEEEKRLSKWISHQITNYKKKSQIMKEQEIYDAWTQFINDSKYKEYLNIKSPPQKRDMSKPEIKPKESKEGKQQRVKGELSTLHQKYKTMNSQNLNTYFKENTDKWNEYHTISKENEESFPEEEIPRNKMIKYLEKLPGKKKKVVADLGCGFAEINHHFKDNSRFEFHNFDHHSSSELVVPRDIKNTELEDYSVDIVILSLAMWGSNCGDYLKEAYRILDTGGTLLISEAYKRWNKELNNEGAPINRLENMLKNNNFTIIEKQEQKFMFIICRKQ